MVKFFFTFTITASLLLFNVSQAAELKRPAFIKESTTNNKPLSDERQIIWETWHDQFTKLKEAGVTKEQIAEFDNAADDEKNKFGLLRIQIIDQKIYVDTCKDHSHKSRLKYWLKGLREVVAKYKIPNVDLVLSFDDKPPVEFNNQAVSLPIFHADKPHDRAHPNIILIPDIYMMNRWQKLYGKIKAAHRDHPWNRKIEKVYWRGAASGGDYKLSSLDKLPRLSLVMNTTKHPDKIDARFTEDAQFAGDKEGKDLYASLQSLSLFGPRVQEEDHLAYKYLISLDGNVSAWHRPVWIMASNSVLLLQHQYSQWFYPALKPWVHYVPLKNDISDLFERLDWLKNHDQAAKQISENANSLVENALQPDHIIEDLAFVITQYADLQKFELTEPTLPPAPEPKKKGLFSF